MIFIYYAFYINFKILLYILYDLFLFKFNIFYAVYRTLSCCFFRQINIPVSNKILVKNNNTWYNCINVASYNYLGININDINWINELLYYYGKFKISHDDNLLVELKNIICNFLKKDSCILVTTGFSINAIFLPKLWKQGTNLILSDSSNHASIIEGIKFLKINSKCIIFKHNDFSYLEKIIQSNINNYDNIWVVTEGIFSCYGTITDLPYLIKLRNKYRFKLIIDEAHSFGCIGKSGKGICDYYNIDTHNIDLIIGTFSKTFNSQGGFICGNNQYIDVINEDNLNKDITLLPAVNTIHIINIFKLLLTNVGKDKLKKLYNISKYAYEQFKNNNIQIYSESHITPVLSIKEEVYFKASYDSEFALSKGIALVLVGYPASSKFFLIKRICLNSNITKNDIDYLISVLKYKPFSRKIETFKSIKTYDNVHDIIKYCGIGTCRPRGFYGNILQHINLEKKIALKTGYQTSFFLPCYYTGIANSFEILFKNSTKIYIPLKYKNNTIINRSIILSRIKPVYVYSNIITVKYLFKTITVSFIENINNYIYNSDICIGIINDNVNYGAFLACSTSFKHENQLAIRSYIFSAASPAYLSQEVSDFISN